MRVKERRPLGAYGLEGLMVFGHLRSTLVGVHYKILNWLSDTRTFRVIFNVKIHIQLGIPSQVRGNHVGVI